MEHYLITGAAIVAGVAVLAKVGTVFNQYVNYGASKEVIEGYQKTVLTMREASTEILCGNRPPLYELYNLLYSSADILAHVSMFPESVKMGDDIATVEILKRNRAIIYDALYPDANQCIRDEKELSDIIKVLDVSDSDELKSALSDATASLDKLLDHTYNPIRNKRGKVENFNTNFHVYVELAASCQMYINVCRNALRGMNV